MKKSACIISIVSLLIVSFTIVEVMKIKIMHKDTSKANLLVVKDNSIKAAQPNSQSPDIMDNKSLPLLQGRSNWYSWKRGSCIKI